MWRTIGQWNREVIGHSWTMFESHDGDETIDDWNRKESEDGEKEICFWEFQRKKVESDLWQYQQWKRIVLLSIKVFFSPEEKQCKWIEKLNI